MGILSIILLVLFVIVSLLLVFLIAVQDESSQGLGSIFGGSSESTFGSGSSKFITKITTILAIAFLVLAILVAFLNKSNDSALLDAAEVNNSTWYQDSATSQN